MIHVDYRNVRKVLTLGLMALAALHVLLQSVPMTWFPGDGYLRQFVDLGAERSFATWLSAVLWLAAAVVAWLIGVADRETGTRGYRWWWAFAAIPLAISIDEIAGIHETLSSPVRRALDLDGALYFAWVIPVTVVAALVGAIFLRFYARQPRWLQIRLALAAALAFGGAIGVELVGSAIWRMEGLGPESMAYILTTTVEEVLELSGVAVLAVALLRRLDGMASMLSIKFEAVGGPSLRMEGARRGSAAASSRSPRGASAESMGQ